MKKISDILFSTRAAGIYIIIFALAIGIATFIENDFGTSSAQKVVFRTRWFEILLLLFAGSILTNIFRYKMIQQKKWGTFIFHASILIILLGAGVTRYFGSEGMMHIREGDATNQILSSETYLQFSANYQGNEYKFDEEVLFATLGKNHFKKAYIIGDQRLEVELLNFIPNPANKLVEDPNGAPVIQLVSSDKDGREEYILKYKDFKNINGNWFNFGNSPVEGAYNLDFKDNELIFSSPVVMTQMTMATQALDTISPGFYRPLLVRTLYSAQSVNFVISDFKPLGNTEIISTSPKITSESLCGLALQFTSGGHQNRIFVSGNKGMRVEPRPIRVGDLDLSVSYGAKPLALPFSIKLNDFIMERYPGTNSASSYASEVTLLDNRKNVQKDYRIYMNHILNYNGYRFFQSSYDKDELGTVLSVNHDAWGTWISYTGYFLFTLGLILTLFSRKSRFRQLASTIRNMQSEKTRSALAGFVLMLFAIIASGNSEPVFQEIQTIDKSHAEKFGRLIIQDYRGRMKPVNTLSSEILRKVAHKESMYNQTPNQIILHMMTFPESWYSVPIIKLGKNKKIKEILNVEGEYAAYDDFFVNNRYVLQDYVGKAYEMEQRSRGTFEKELLKVDERLNILNMVFTGRLMRLFPVPDHPEDHWSAPAQPGHQHGQAKEDLFIVGFYSSYINSLKNAVASGDWTRPNQFIDELSDYQKTYGGDIVPSPSKVNMEILLNQSKVFSRLGKVYGLLGLLFLGLFFYSVFNHKIDMSRFVFASFLVLGLCFLAHTSGLGIRWYVSGRAPWSNGYESMIYIAWTTILSGLIFARRSFGGLAATSILASVILMVAGMSWLDPEITPLVPVLRSYWLTIHVSLIAGSYGFLMLGAIIGVINLILMIFTTPSNHFRNNRVIKEMTYTSEMTLIAGLVMLGIGTYLGGVWANESWGRYWGWDAKETWALVTILVYTFILHMRFIPGFRGFYAFNVASLFGFASVMMTYFGVNYYLSGLHSYAAGDPVPIPPAVYYTAITLTVISLLALWRNRANDLQKMNEEKQA